MQRFLEFYLRMILMLEVNAVDYNGVDYSFSYLHIKKAIFKLYFKTAN